MTQHRALLIVGFAVVASLGGALAQSPSELPVSRLVLFTTGVGYFEHAGVVDGTQEIELRVHTEHMDDLLASLVISDLDGGSVLPVRYGARDPLGRVLASYALDLSGDPTLAQLLTQARGETVRITTDEVVTGVLVNVERVVTPEEGVRTLVTLSSDDGLRRIALEDVRDLRFEREGLREDLDAALAAIARARDADANVVRLRFEGEGERRVRVGYVREMPVWKPSYRLVVGGDGRADLQGWAILDNPTALDLVDVQVAFVAGRPISFVSELFSPVYVARQRVGPAVAESIVPPVDAGVFRRDAPAPAPMADMAMEMEVPALRGAGVQAAAEGVDTGASFAYLVRQPVSVGRYESVMVPVIVASVAASSASYLALGSGGPSPLRAVRLVNDSGLHLAAGPVTLFDGAGYAGTALLGDVPPGEERLLAYAVDLDLRVASETSREPESLTAVRLRGALLETEHRLRVRTTVRVSGGAQPRFLVVELPRPAGYEVVAPSPAPAETAEALRFGIAWRGEVGAPGDGEAPADDAVPTHVTCDGDAACRLEVVLERVESRTMALANVDSDRLALYLENVPLSDADRAVLDEVLRAQRRLVALARDASAVQARLDALFRDQERVRQNMAALDRTSSLYRRYLADLEAQEDDVAALGAERDALALARRVAQDELETLLAGLVEDPAD
jgi:hypothetical protein